MNRFTLEKRRILLKICSLGFWLARLALLAVLLTACNASPDPGQGLPAVVVTVPTSTEVAPTATSTTEPTDIPTVTPTVDPNFKEWPASWFEGSLDVAQTGDPNASMTTAPCVFNNEEQCIQTIDYCPEGTECVAYLVVSPTLSFGFGSEPYFHSPSVVIGNEYLTTLWGGGEFRTFAPQGLFVTDEELEIFLCMTGTQENYVLKSESLILVNQALFDVFAADGVFVAHIGRPSSPSECGG